MSHRLEGGLIVTLFNFKDTLELIKTKPFSSIWWASLISNLGSGISSFALMWYIYDKTGSPIQMGGVAVVSGIICLFLGPFLGSYVDRSFRHKEILVATDILSGLVILVTAGLVCSNHFNLLVYYGLVALQTVFYIPQRACCRSIIQSVIDKDMLERGSALLSLSSNSAMMVGPIVGGVMIASVGSASALLLDAVSFFISAWFIFSIPDLVDMRKEGAQNGSIFSMISDGLYYLKTQKTMMYMMIFVGGLQLIVGALPVVLLVFVKEDLNGSAALYGSVETFFMIGLVVTTTVLSFVRLPQGRRPLWILGLILLQTGSLFMMGRLRLVMASLIIMMVFGAADAVFNVMYEGFILKAIDPSQMGRFSSLLLLINKTTQPISIILSSMALKYCSAALLFQFIGGLSFFGAFFVLLVPGLATLGVNESRREFSHSSSLH